MEGKKVLFISSEVVPYMPQTEISNLTYNLPKVVNENGGLTRIFIPKYGNINERRHQLHEVIINQKNDFYNSRLERVKMINRRSDFNQFAFHLSNPIMIFFRNIFLKLLTKNKKFLQSYLGKIYKD